MIKFKADRFFSRIDAVEVVRETEQCVFLSGSGGRREVRELKHSDDRQWCDTWDEAHAYLMQDAQRAVDSARMALERAKGKLGNIKGMKRPEVPK